MKILLVYALALGFVGTGAMLVQRGAAGQKGQSMDAQMASDAAYRDGVYLGKLAHTANSPMRPPIGRWSTEKDRASFAAGYRQGYSE